MIENPVSINGIRDILSKFSESDLFTLCGTVTQGLLKNKIRDKEDAIDCIVKHSANETSLLKRKVITRTHLFEYLHDLGVAVTPPVTKDELVERITKLWSEQTTPQIANIVSNPPSDGGLTENVLDMMGKQFSEWFYGLMNKSERIGVEHFFPDASVNIQLIHNETVIERQAINSASDVSNLLYNTRHEYNLFFHPNLHSEGTKAKMNQHGLVLVMSCGTLHVNSNVAGVFEQIFALARDPFSDDNWKIRNSKLILRNKPNINSVPSLQDTDLMQIDNL